MTDSSVDSLFQLTGVKISNYTRRSISEDLARQLDIVPISLRNNRLLVSSAYPLTRKEVFDIQSNAGFPVDTLLSSLTDIRAIQYDLYEKDVYRSPVLPMSLVLRTLGLLSNEQIFSLAHEQQETGETLADLALRRNLISESQWGEAVGLCYQIPHLRTQISSPINGISFLLPINQADAFGAMPLWWVGDLLYVAVTDPKSIDDLSPARGFHYTNRPVIVSPNVFKQIRRKAYLQQGFQFGEVNEKRVADILAQHQLVSNSDLVYAKELNRQTGESIRQILINWQRITPANWSDALAESHETYAIHPEDLPDDLLDRIRAVLNTIPKFLILQYGLLPLTLEHGTLVVGAPTLSRDLQNLLAGITGYQVEIRLMDEDITNSLLNALQPDLESQDDRGFVGGNPVSLHKFLLSTGILDEDYLQEILKKAEKKSKSLPDALLNAMVINELDLVELYSILSGIPYISLEYFQFQDDLINKIPAELCIRHTLLPLFETDRDVWIGISDPTDCAAFREVERITKKRAWPVLTPKTLLATTIRRFYQYHRQHTDSDEIFAFADQLVQEGLFNQSDAFQVVRWVVDEKIPFDRAVLRLGHIRSDALYQSLAKILKVNLAKIDLTEIIEEGIDALGQKTLTRKWQESIDVDTAKLIDLSTAQRLMVIPISQGPIGIVVAFADPFYTDALEELSSRFHQKIIPCLAPRETIEAAIQRILGQKNLGTALLTSGLITLNQLNNGLALSRKTNIRLGKALVHRRFITEQQLYQFLAQQAHLPLFDLSKVEVDGKTARILDADLERRYGMLPLASDETSVLLAVVDPLNADAISAAEQQTHRSVRPVLVTEQDFDDAMERIYRDDYLAKSTLQLLERSPEDSAYRVLSRSQVIVLVILVALTLFWIVIDYRSLLVVANCFATLFYLLFSIYKGYLIAHAINNDLEVQISEEEVAALDDRDLPVYTVLVPVYKEANVLPHLIERLEKLDYPAPKLDVKVLLEADDQDTINAFFACNPPDFIKGIVVPSAQPKTKPKACNYGLIHARGEYLVIYDAEDRPDPDQLKRSVLAYQKVPPEVVCIQAKLNYYNRNQNLLTQWFTSEYSMWFDLLLPGLDAANAPIPLGGTSNHFKTFSLIEAGAWDPHNVTEDADLGIRLYKRGYRTRIMDSTTYEEANSQTNNWIRQRSRWIKGYIQTWLVHMRHPLRLIKDIGLPAFFSFQLLIGGTFFALLMNPIYWMMTSAWYFFHLDFIQSMYPGFIFYIGAFCLYIGNFAFTYANVAGAMRRKYYDMVESAIFSPLYWGLMSIAAWKGFIQLIRKPHFWEKTTHGLDQKAQKANPGTETV